VLATSKISRLESTVHRQNGEHTEKRDDIYTSQLEEQHDTCGKHRSVENSLWPHLEDLHKRPFARKLEGELNGLDFGIYLGIVGLDILQGG
jgi:hypothetical protein